METKTLSPEALEAMDGLLEWAERVAEERGCDPSEIVFEALETPEGKYVVTIAPQREVV